MHRTETNLNLLKRKHQNRSHHDGLDHDATPSGLRKAASCNVLGLICKNKRRRTMAWQAPPAAATSTMSNYKVIAEKPSALAQRLAKQLRNKSTALKIATATSKTDQAISEVLQTLRTLTSSAACKDKSACDIAVLTMNRFPSCLPLQTEGCLALRRYIKASSATARGGLTSECLAALLRALVNHSDSGSYLQHLVIDCLRLVSRNAKGRMLMTEHDQCIRLVVRVLEAAPLDFRLQELGLSLISFLVEDEACRKQIIEHGGVTIIVRSMKNHAANALIQCNASAALGWLVHLDHVEAKAALLATEDAIPTILDIAKRYVDNASVFGNCVCILCGVRVGDRAVAETYPDLGSPTRQLLQMGMQKNRTALKVQRNCMMLLRLTTESEGETGALDDAQKKSFKECIRVVVSCMKEFPNECEIQSFACRVLCNLTVNAETRALVMETDGCINQVVCALDKHKGDAGVLQGGCWFLQAILHAGVEDQPGVTTFGGGLAVLRLMLTGLGIKVVANPVDALV